MSSLGRIVILNGPPRAGKSSIAGVIQETFEGIWMCLGSDLHISSTPPAYRPGVGLRPQKPEHATSQPGRVSLPVLEAVVPILYEGLYESIAAHSRLGLNVVADMSHHDVYSRPKNILARCAARLSGLPVLFVGVGCPVDVIWERRKRTWGQEPGEVDAGVVASVDLGQIAFRAHTYDLELDTSRLSPEACAARIWERLESGPSGTAFPNLVRDQEV